MVFSPIPQNSLLNKIKNDYKVIPSTSAQHKETEIVDESKTLSPSTSLFPDTFCKSFLSRAGNQTLLGKGSFGRVILGRIDSKKVAVKICSRNSCECIGERNGLTLKHPNITRIYRIWEIDQIDFSADIINYISSVGLPLDIFKRFGAQIVVMEFCGRQTLQQLLDDSQQEISAQRRNHLINQIAYGIRYCHDSKVVHLDIKPANVMVMFGDICKLVDFGSSKRIEISHQCHQEFTIGKRTPLGTAIYCAPEIFSNISVTPKADIYSFGITMWQMITRVVPFSNFQPHSIIYRVC